MQLGYIYISDLRCLGGSSQVWICLASVFSVWRYWSSNVDMLVVASLFCVLALVEQVTAEYDIFLYIFLSKMSPIYIYIYMNKDTTCELIHPCSKPVKDHIRTLICMPFETECPRMSSSIPVRSVVSFSIHTTAPSWSSEVPTLLRWFYRRFIFLGRLDQVAGLGIHISGLL